MRIAHLIDDLGCGGAEQVVVNLAASQARNGNIVWVVCLRDLGGQTVDLLTLERAGVQIVPLHKPPGLHFGTLRRLYGFLKAQRIDILHAHNHLVQHYAAVSARLAGTVCLNTLHGTASVQSSAAWTKALFWASCLLSKKVVSVCAGVEAVLKGAFHLPARKLSVVDNGIDLTAFLRISRIADRRPTTFGTIARLEAVKDHRTLLRAFGLLRRDHPYIRLRLLGDGSLRKELEGLAFELQVADAVSFEGFSLDTAGFLTGIDVYVISSRSEGLPLTLLEAMGAGLPIVATSVGEIPTIVSDSGCGWLCPPASPEALRDSMRAALVATDTQEIGAKGRKFAMARYSADRMAADYAQIYSNLLPRRRGLSGVS
jgi:glycosyltransferase involved in cell wall biosynthesis